MLEKKDKVAAVISAISQTMTCDKCPFPCEAKEYSSYRNCNRNWWETLHELGVDVPWEDVSDLLFSIFDEHSKKGGSCDE